MGNYLYFAIIILYSEKPAESTIPSEQQLAQLTDFVSFLENWLLLKSLNNQELIPVNNQEWIPVCVRLYVVKFYEDNAEFCCN